MRGRLGSWVLLLVVVARASGQGDDGGGGGGLRSNWDDSPAGAIDGLASDPEVERSLDDIEGDDDDYEARRRQRQLETTLATGGNHDNGETSLEATGRRTTKKNDKDNGGGDALFPFNRIRPPFSHGNDAPVFSVRERAEGTSLSDARHLIHPLLLI